MQQISLPSSLDSIHRVDEMVEDAIARYPQFRDKYDNIQIAVSEALNNSIIHGNKLIREKMVHCSYEFHEDCLEFIIEDEGEGFDPASIPDPTLPENIEKLSGRGIFLIRNLADFLTFENNGQITRIKFIAK